MGDAHDVGACVVVIDTLQWRGCFSFWPGEGGEGLHVNMRKRTGLEKKMKKVRIYSKPHKKPNLHRHRMSHACACAWFAAAAVVGGGCIWGQ